MRFHASAQLASRVRRQANRREPFRAERDRPGPAALPRTMITWSSRSRSPGSMVPAASETRAPVSRNSRRMAASRRSAKSRALAGALPPPPDDQADPAAERGAGRVRHSRLSHRHPGRHGQVPGGPGRADHQLWAGQLRPSLPGVSAASALHHRQGWPHHPPSPLRGRAARRPRPRGDPNVPGELPAPAADGGGIDRLAGRRRLPAGALPRGSNATSCGGRCGSPGQSASAADAWPCPPGRRLGAGLTRSALACASTWPPTHGCRPRRSAASGAIAENFRSDRTRHLQQAPRRRPGRRTAVTHVLADHRVATTPGTGGVLGQQTGSNPSMWEPARSLREHHRS
jgi:hypothetical protein